MSSGSINEVTGRINRSLSGVFRAVIVSLLVLIQFGLIIYLSYKLRMYTVYIYSFLQILSVIIIIMLINDNRNVSYKISWICIIAVFPVTGHIMYMLWGNNRVKKIDKIVLKNWQEVLNIWCRTVRWLKNLRINILICLE